MLEQIWRRWTLGLLGGVLTLLCACAGVVYAVDPCFYYRAPTGDASFFNERYQDAGLAKNIPADTVLLGTSMVANYRADRVADTFGGTAVKLTIPDGYLSEFDRVMKVVWRNGTPKRVVFGADVNILTRDESGLTGVMPGYLYDNNPLNDVKYLLNKDTLYYSVYTQMERRWGSARPLDEAYTWDQTTWWNHAEALDNYDRPEIAGATLPADAYFTNVDANLRVIEGWITAHPDTEFDLFFPPYSILFWDKVQRLGESEAVLAAMERACDALLAFPNVKLYGFVMDRDIVTNLDNYCDYIHHSGAVCNQVLNLMAADQYRLTPENARETIAKWRDFVVYYDYDVYWDSSFWIQWNQTHAAHT